jgi:hypothetical protein
MTGTTVAFRCFEVIRVGTSIDMRPAAAGQLPGVTAIGVTVNDAARSVRHIESAGYRVQRAADGTVVLPAGDARPSSPGAWRRINHVVVAVQDDDAAQQDLMRHEAAIPWQIRAAKVRPTARGSLMFRLTEPGRVSMTIRTSAAHSTAWPSVRFAASSPAWCARAM